MSDLEKIRQSINQMQDIMQTLESVSCEDFKDKSSTSAINAARGKIKAAINWLGCITVWES